MKQINWSAFVRSLIISTGVAIPLFIILLIISTYIPGSNINGGFFGQIHKEPSTTWYIIFTGLAFCMLLIDFAIGLRYYRSITGAKPVK
jgi:succinate dehydrogenase/fumarate reductase cytochrome b subunit